MWNYIKQACPFRGIVYCTLRIVQAVRWKKRALCRQALSGWFSHFFQWGVQGGKTF